MKKEIQGKIRKHNNPTMIDYKHLKALKTIQKDESHLKMQFLMAAIHYDCSLAFFITIHLQIEIIIYIYIYMKIKFLNRIYI